MASSHNDAILELKRAAIECKKTGDIEQAKRLLSKARALEYQDVSPEDLSTPGELKQLALVLKGKGDIQGAKAALAKAKQLEASPPAEPEPVQIEVDPVNTASDAATLDELDPSFTNGNKAVTFTDDEMLDTDTMVEFQSAGMDIPARSEYEARVLACKKAALAAKNAGDIPKAMRYLQKSKQFAAALNQLHSTAAGAPMEQELDPDEDYSLLDELKLYDELGGIEGGMLDQLDQADNKLGLDEIDDLDHTMLKDMMDMGMEIPNVDEVLETSKKKKSQAVAFKNDGNIPAAKAVLTEAKDLEAKATRLADLLAKMKDSDSAGDDPDSMLEAMLSPQKPQTHAAQEPKVQKKVSPQPVKSSAEYKADAVRLKKEGKMEDALVALRLHKKVLSDEASAVEKARRANSIKVLHEELHICKKQHRLFSFYGKSVDQAIGTEQMAFWRQYSKKCSSKVEELQADSSKSVSMSRLQEGAMKSIDGEDLSFVGRACDPLEEKLEVAILDVLDLDANKFLRKAICDDSSVDSKAKLVLKAAPDIVVHVTIQLPPHAKADDECIEFKVKPETTCLIDDTIPSYNFETPEKCDIERGLSRFAKTLRRRMSRKRVTLAVYYVPPSKKKFWSSAKEEDVIIGTAVVSLSNLLDTNFVAGDFPLLDPALRKEVGGTVRLILRTGTPYSTGTEDTQKDAAPCIAPPESSFSSMLPSACLGFYSELTFE